jgi:hypothetical protein
MKHSSNTFLKSHCKEWINKLGVFQDWWDNKLPEQGILSCLSVIPKVLLAGAITLMDEAYYKLAVWLNDKGESLEQGYRARSLIRLCPQKTIACSLNTKII